MNRFYCFVTSDWGMTGMQSGHQTGTLGRATSTADVQIAKKNWFVRDKINMNQYEHF
jgi:hypothetical protein